MEEPSAIKIIGHRGAAGLVFENTLASIQKALDLGIEIIEIDVWQTTDGEIVVFHDTYLDRLTETTGFIAEISYQNLKNISLKNGDKIPTLKEVIALILPYSVQLIVEVKDPKALPEAQKILRDSLPYSRYYIGSFYHSGIMKLKQEDPQIKTAIMFECAPVDLPEYLEKVNPDLVVISIETFDEELVNTVKIQNRKLVFYTVNTEGQFALARRASPYGIVTNFPDRFLTDPTAKNAMV